MLHLNSKHFRSLISSSDQAKRKIISSKNKCLLRFCAARSCWKVFLDTRFLCRTDDVLSVCLQGMAFSMEERLQLGIHGLLPPCFISQDVQLLRVLKNYDMKKDDLDR